MTILQTSWQHIRQKAKFNVVIDTSPNNVHYTHYNMQYSTTHKIK